MSISEHQSGVDGSQSSALQRLVAAGVDPIITRADVRAALSISYPTISRMQRRGEFPQFEQISPGRRGLRRSTLEAFLAGRRDWSRGQ